MRRQGDPTLVLGLVLLAVSGLLFLDRAEVLPTAALLWTAVLAVAGGAFASSFLADRRQWWAAIPAGALLGMASVIAWTELAGLDDDVGGALFLGLVALGFWAVFARDRRHWWALIPGGALTTLAAVAGLSSTGAGGAAVGAVFFLGLAATFLLVALVPRDGRRRWAYVPAAVLGAIGVVTTLDAVVTLPLADYAGPAVLAAVGLFLLWRSVPRHHGRT